MLDEAAANAMAPWGTHRPGITGRLLIGVSRRSLLGRGAARRVVSALFDRVHKGAVDCVLWGSRVRLFPTHNLSERKALMRPDHMDALEYEFLRSHMRKPGSIFVDIGANAGLYSLHAALNAGAGARIIAIEPSLEMMRRFAYNVALMRAAGRIDPSVDIVTVTAAAGDKDGEALLSASPCEGGRSLLAGTGEPITVRRLAGLVQEHRVPHIDLMKLDVEGYEDRVLPPYLENTAPEVWPRVILIEHLSRSKWAVDCIAHCQERGYRTLFVTRTNTILARACLHEPETRGKSLAA